MLEVGHIRVHKTPVKKVGIGLESDLGLLLSQEGIIILFLSFALLKKLSFFIKKFKIQDKNPRNLMHYVCTHRETFLNVQYMNECMLPRTIVYGLKALTMQWKSPHAIKKFQEKKLQHIVNHAYRNSRFYKTIFDELNVNPGDIKTLNDLKMLPTVTKTDLRTHFCDVLARGFSEKNCAVETTSGSTGEKITILHDFNAIDYYSPVHQRGHIALGLKPYHKAVYIRYKPMNASILEQFGLFRFHHIFSDNLLDDIIKELKQVRPFEIGCYPTVMYLLAKK